MTGCSENESDAVSDGSRRTSARRRFLTANLEIIVTNSSRDEFNWTQKIAELTASIACQAINERSIIMKNESIGLVQTGLQCGQMDELSSEVTFSSEEKGTSILGRCHFRDFWEVWSTCKELSV
jgi:hypothetical protein